MDFLQDTRYNNRVMDLVRRVGSCVVRLIVTETFPVMCHIPSIVIAGIFYLYKLLFCY